MEVPSQLVKTDVQSREGKKEEKVFDEAGKGNSYQAIFLNLSFISSKTHVS